MTDSFSVEESQGIHALDTNQEHRRGDGYGVIDPGTGAAAVSANNKTLGQPDTLSVAAGDVLVDGTVHTLSQTDVGIDAANSTYPRRDVVYVDSSGAVQVAKGAPEAQEPTGQGLSRFEFYRPAPPDLNATNGTVVAEVWVAAGASSLDSADIRDRRQRALGPHSLDEDVATQSELDTHVANTGAHHPAYTDSDATANAESNAGVVYATAQSGADLPAKISNALSALPGGQGTVVVGAKDDGSAWSWPSQLDIQVDNYDGVEIRMAEDVSIDVTIGAGEYVFDFDSDANPGAYGPNTPEGSFTVRGGLWECANATDPGGFIRATDVFNGVVADATIRDLANSSTNATVFHLRNVDQFTEGFTVTNVTVKYADRGLQTDPASVTGGGGEDSFNHLTFHGVRFDGINDIGYYNNGGIWRGSTFVQVPVWTGSDGVVCWQLEGNTADTTIIGPKFEGSNTGMTFVYIRGIYNLPTFVEPTLIGVDTVVDSDTYGPPVVQDGAAGVWDSAGAFVAATGNQDASVGLTADATYFDSDQPENDPVAYRAELASGSGDNFVDVLRMQDADGSDDDIAWQRLGGGTAAALRVRNKTAGADLFGVGDDGTVTLMANDLVDDQGTTIYDYSAQEVAAALADQLVTPATVDGSGGTSGQVLQTDGTAGGVSWSDSGGLWTQDGTMATGSATSHTYTLNNTWDEVLVHIRRLVDENGGQDIKLRLNGSSNTDYDWWDISGTKTDNDDGWQIATGLTLNSAVQGELQLRGTWNGRAGFVSDLTGEMDLSTSGERGNAPRSSPLSSITFVGVSGNITVEAEILGRNIA